MWLIDINYCKTDKNAFQYYYRFVDREKHELPINLSSKQSNYTIKCHFHCYCNSWACVTDNVGQRTTDWPKSVHQWYLTGKRSKGRPNKRWMDCTEEDLWRAGVTKFWKPSGRERMTLKDIAADRQPWRNLMAEICWTMNTWPDCNTYEISVLLLAAQNLLHQGTELMSNSTKCHPLGRLFSSI